MRKHLYVYESSNGVAVAAIERIIEYANQAIISRGVFRIALAGGSTPRRLYEVIRSDEYRDKTEWSLWEFYFSDERIVPLTDENSNYRMAKDTLLNDDRFREDHIYVPSVQLKGSMQVALDYEEQIRRSFNVDNASIPCFDLILLGLGSDGHTASLFPNKSTLNETRRLIIETAPGSLPPAVDRITFTLPLINAAHHVMFLASGKDKRRAFQAAYDGISMDDTETAPAYLVVPDKGDLVWYVTKDLLDT